ncbi:MAG TPA: diadenosine tetraphosphate hydrolase [Mycobacteriales bacterium]|nr:diadenosine tetraphosphate hydrolase [Mycobacteriales bacterium]
MAANWKSDRIGSSLRGDNPTVLRRLQAGFAIIGDIQFLPGYCVLLTDTPGIERLSDLPKARRMEFLADLDLLVEAVERVCARRDPAFRRANLSILGNHDPFLHAHVFARYDWEPAEFISGPIDLYPAERKTDPATLLGPQHDGLRADLTAEIDHMTRD